MTSVDPGAGMSTRRFLVLVRAALKAHPCAAEQLLQPGDVLVIYSDGVTEAVSPTGEEFGPTRLYEVVSRNIDASAAGIRDRIESALTKFSQGTQAADDITLVIVKRQAETRQLSLGASRG